MSYSGSDRRRHRVYVTRNTEYHLRDGVCVAVRDRQSSAFRTAHIALNLKLEGIVKSYSNGAVLPHAGEPVIGDAIYFNDARDDGEERQIVTSKLERIDRPAKAVVIAYPDLAMAV
ncbi:MAG: hypothetical protein WKG00_15225 [Polyangiaceae bacterium]